MAACIPTATDVNNEMIPIASLMNYLLVVTKSKLVRLFYIYIRFPSTPVSKLTRDFIRGIIAFVGRAHGNGTITYP